jgi:hypothetical protein
MIRSRAAINYWNDAGLDVRCWLYLVYETDGEAFDVELTPFRIDRDNPYQDLASVYYLLNTNYGNDPQDDHDMLDKEKAAAFFDPWKRRIEALNQGDVVFLYRSGDGIVAYGKASGLLERHPYQGDPKHPDEEYSMRLNGFRRLSDAVPAAEIKAVAGSGITFRQNHGGPPRLGGPGADRTPSRDWIAKPSGGCGLSGIATLRECLVAKAIASRDHRQMLKGVVAVGGQ